MSFGNVGRRWRYACSKMRYCEGISWRARSSGIGTIETVPLRTPVALFGYVVAIGFGESSDWHVIAATESRVVFSGVLALLA